MQKKIIVLNTTLYYYYLYSMKNSNENPEYMICIYCHEKDENKLLKNTFKNKIVCKSCYNIVVEMTKPFRNNSYNC